MADTFGLSFAPLSNAQNPQQPNSGGGYGGGQVSPVQQAIQILSLRQPRVFGAGSISSPQLLNAAGGGGVPDLQSLLKALMMHLQGQMGLPDQGGMGGGPNPSAGGGAAPPGGAMSNPLASIFGVPTGPAPMPPSPPPTPDPRITPGGEPGPSQNPREDLPAPVAPSAPPLPVYGGRMGGGDRDRRY